MKRYVLLLSVVLGVFSFSVVSASNKEKVGPVKIGAAQMKSLIYDYVANPDQWVYKGDKPCIIDFYADWCGPCRLVAPILDDLADVYKDRIVVYKVDVDREKEIAAIFGIRSIPALLFVPVGGQPKMNEGALPKDVFIEQIETFLLAK